MLLRLLKLTSPYLSGEDVRQAQALLAARGHSPGKIDGVFGPNTHAAVLSFQKEAFSDKPSEWDGVIGPKTRAKLEEAPVPPGENIRLFIERLRGEVQNGSIYVWGAQGQSDITAAWIERRETSKTNAARAVRLWQSRLAAGFTQIRAFDCSGLILYHLNEMGLYKGDLSSRGLYAKCAKIKRAELAPGDLVFRHNGLMIHHVGVYIGEGEAIEAKGRDDGVVLRKLDASGSTYWNRYGRLGLLERMENTNE